MQDAPDDWGGGGGVSPLLLCIDLTIHMLIDELRKWF